MRQRDTVLFPITDLTVDGAQQQLLALVKGLDKDRFRPVILTLLPGGPLEPEFKRVPGVRVLSLKRKGKYDFFYLLKVFLVLRRLRVAVVQPFLTPATLFGLLPALLCRVPVKVVTERSGPGARDSGLGYRIYLKAEDFLTRFADWAVPNSRAGGEYLIRRGIKPGRIRVIYNGINLARLSCQEDVVSRVKQRLNLPPGGKVVGMVARLFPVKRHDIFIQAASLISQALPQTRFALVGDGPLRGELENLAHELGVAPKMIFFGQQRDVGNYVSAFDVGCLTSEAEGCSNVLLEAMALGKPVVCTDVGGNRELVEHGKTGFLVPPGDAQALAKAVLALLQDSQMAESIGRQASEIVASRFSLSHMVAQYQTMYEETLRKKGNREQSSVGRRAARELILLCTTSQVGPQAKERISQLLARPLDWEHLQDLAVWHGIAPLIANSLMANGFSSHVPPQHMGYLEEARRQTQYKNVVLSAETERILRVFSSRRIQAIPLKGTVLAESIYGNLGSRATGDMDILVSNEDLAAARESLVELGYHPLAPKQDEPDGHPFHGSPYIRNGNLPLVLELHWGLADTRLVAFRDQEIWGRAQPLELNGFSTLTLSPEDNLLFLTSHLWKHESHLLRFLCDIAELLKKYGGSLDWDYITRSAGALDTGPSLYYSLRLAKDLLEVPVPAPLLEGIKPPAWRRWLLEALLAPDTFVSPMKWERLRKATLALAHSLMMKRPPQMLAALSRHRGRGGPGARVKTSAWMSLALSAGLGRYLVGVARRRHVRRAS